MIFIHLLYIYQLENYDKRRFLAFAYSHLKWHRIAQRGELTWTLRSQLIFALSLFFYFASIALTFWKISPYWAPVPFLLGIIFFPFLILLADICLAPLVRFQKKRITKLASSFILRQQEKGLITIGITGSYGKTTMREVLHFVLKQKYSVFTFPGNINTDIGIAQYILSHQKEIAAAEVLIAEMGAYHVGEIADLCAIIHPDYSVTTAIGDAHLDRFGSRENIARGKLELATNTKKIAVLNAKDAGIQKYTDQFLPKSEKNIFVSAAEKNIEITEKNDFSGISFSYLGEEFSTKIIAKYIVDFAVLAFEIAKRMDVSAAQMKQAFADLDFVPHRLQVIKNEALNRTIIDDSYNGNEAGFLEGLRILARAQGRKIVLTPGIVELGKESKEVHIRLAKKYAETLDFLLLVKNPNTKIIMKELKKLDFKNYKMYSTAAEAHSDLPNVLKNGDTILFQNDATDNYS